jgi:hypothetical protein
MLDAGNTQALVLIAFLVVTPVLCVAGYGKPGRWRVLAGLVVGPLLALVCGVSGLHKCDLGQPFMQWVVPGACMTAVLVCVRNRWIRFTAVALFFAASTWLCQDFAHRVHTDYAGNLAKIERDQKGMLHAAREHIRNKATGDARIYPAGWMNEAPFIGLLDGIDHANVDPACATPLWHSWLTGLYALHEVRLWYPGGRLSEAVDRIEYREWK